MRAKIVNELLIIGLLTILLGGAIILAPDNPIRIILGIPFVLFSPGYALVSAIFPRKGEMDVVGRIALSFGMSIAVVSLIGLGLNYTKWGIRLESIIYAVGGFILLMLIIAIIRRAKLPDGERAGIGIKIQLWAAEQRAFNKSLSFLVILSMLGVMGTLGYFIANPKVGEKFTEFYILGLDGMAHNYPTEFIMDGDAVILVRYGEEESQEVAGESGTVTAGIVNHKQEPATYIVRVTIDGEPVPVYLGEEELDELGPIVLDHEERWEHKIGFAPQHVSESQKVEFVLYKDESPYFKDTPHLWIDVKGQE